MDMLNILLTAALLFMLFLTPSLVKRWYVNKRYLTMLDKYRDDYERIDASRPKLRNVYNIEDYRDKFKHEKPDDILEYSRTHVLVWSEELQEYEKIPKNTLTDDDDA